MKTCTVISIGHGAYTGANRPATAHTKAQAVRILRLRGLDRNKARAVVEDVCKRRHGYVTARGEGSDVIEVTNVTERAVSEGWPCLRYSRAQKQRYGEMA